MDEYDEYDNYDDSDASDSDSSYAGYEEPAQDNWWDNDVVQWAGDTLGTAAQGADDFTNWALDSDARGNDLRDRVDDLNRLIAQPNDSYADAAQASGMERATDYLGVLADNEPGQMTTNVLEDLGVPGHEDFGFELGPIQVGPRELAGAVVGNLAMPGGGETDDIVRAARALHPHDFKGVPFEQELAHLDELNRIALSRRPLDNGVPLDPHIVKAVDPADIRHGTDARDRLELERLRDYRDNYTPVRPMPNTTRRGGMLTPYLRPPQDIE